MLKLQRLSKRFGARWALQDLDLSIGAGEIQCLLGANGAGKTTTLNLVLGFLSPTSGAAYVNCVEVAGNAARARAQLAFVPEQVSLYPLLTGLENLVYFTRLGGRYDVSPAQLRSKLDLVGLDAHAIDERVERYSKGMRQKVALAIAVEMHTREPELECLERLGSIALRLNQYPDAGRYYQRALALAEAEFNQQHAIAACEGLGQISFCQGQWAGAQAWFGRGLRLVFGAGLHQPQRASRG